MKKLESNFINMFLVLFIISFVSAAALAKVYQVTKDKIEAGKTENEMAAVASVLMPDYENDPVKDMFVLKTPEGEEIKCYPARKSGQMTSVAIKSFSNRGYSGFLGVMVGLLPDGSIYKMNVYEQKETPGLGTKVTLPGFMSQFEGKNPTSFKLKVRKDGGDVDAVTAATISSRAFTDAVRRAWEVYTKHTSHYDASTGATKKIN
jgi:electron transport complex protein RnfG